MNNEGDKTHGISGRLAASFQNSALTPLLALAALLLGFFAIAVTPKEEEPNRFWTHCFRNATYQHGIPAL